MFGTHTALQLVSYAGKSLPDESQRQESDKGTEAGSDESEDEAPKKRKKKGEEVTLNFTDRTLPLAKVLQRKSVQICNGLHRNDAKVQLICWAVLHAFTTFYRNFGT